MDKRIEKLTPMTIRDNPFTWLNAAAYARVSSGKESMLQSLSAQISYYSAYIQRHKGWKYAGVYADEACTGTKATRPEFQRMLEDCRAGKLNIIVTKSVSRFARNTVTLLSVLRELRELGVAVFFEKENVWSNSGDGELMVTILASYARRKAFRFPKTANGGFAKVLRKASHTAPFTCTGIGSSAVCSPSCRRKRRLSGRYTPAISPAWGWRPY